MIAKLFVEAEQLFVEEGFADSELPNFGPIDRVLGLIFVRNLQLGDGGLSTRVGGASISLRTLVKIRSRMNAGVMAPVISTTCMFSASVVTSTMTLSIGLERNIVPEGVYESGVETVGDCRTGERKRRRNKRMDVLWLDETRSRTLVESGKTRQEGATVGVRRALVLRQAACCRCGRTKGA